MTDCLSGFKVQGKVSFIVGGQWGSEGKGCAAAWVADQMSQKDQTFNIVTTNAAAQAGHTSIHNGKVRVVYHLPTVPLIVQDNLGNPRCITYLNAGCIIDPKGLEKELNDNPINGPLFIHPMAAVITDECRAAELDPNSSHTKIAGTRKGVGQALSRKVARSGRVAKDHPFLKKFTKVINLNYSMKEGKSVLVEVPQGVSLSLNHSGFYPYCTSRDCTPAAAMSDAGINPLFYNSTMVVLRTFPIRVGNISEGGKEIGNSGPHYRDQKETSWDELGVAAEITTVTKRIRRVFTFSQQQIVDTFSLCRPDYVFLTFCNYLQEQEQLDRIVGSIRTSAMLIGDAPPKIIYQWGATTKDAGEYYQIEKNEVAVA